MAERLNQDTLAAALAQPGRLVLVDFYLDSCLPCKRLSPLLAELEAQFPQVLVGKVNLAFAPALAERYQVLTAPTLLLFRGGQEAARLSGVPSRETLARLLEQHTGQP